MRRLQAGPTASALLCAGWGAGVTEEIACGVE